LWRGINGKRKFDKPTTPPLPEIPEGMMLVECREMVLLRENLTEARAESHELAQKVLRLKENGENYAKLLESKLHPDGMVLVAATELERLRDMEVKSDYLKHSATSANEKYESLRDAIANFVDTTPVLLALREAINE
jgi:hypothetical protein